MITDIDPEKLTRALFEIKYGSSGAKIYKETGRWKVSGEVFEKTYQAISEFGNAFIVDNDPMDLSDLRKKPAPVVIPEFERRSRDIDAVKIEYESGKARKVSQVVIAIETVVGKMKAMDHWCLENGRPLPFYELHALPLIGEFVEENGEVEKIRLGHLVEAIRSAGISRERLTLHHDDDIRPGRNGLYVKTKPTPKP